MASLSGRQFRAILRKDIVMELRTREMLTSMGLYALLTMVVYYVALTTAETLDVSEIAAGLLWLAFIFTSMLGLNRSLVHEKDQGCIEALLLSPIDRPVIFFAKATGNLIFILTVAVITLPVFAFLFGMWEELIGGLWMVLLVVFGGALGIAGLGTLLATISVNTSGKDFILTVLFIPLIYPLLLGVVWATSVALSGGAMPMEQFWLAMAWVAGFDIIMLLIAFALYEFIIGA
jgi:heme exporter protein B